MKINIAKDYNPHPLGRYNADSHFSGQRFRKEFLFPRLKEALDKDEILEVSFDGLVSCGSSFLEEAFAGLYRHEKLDISLARLKKVLHIETSENYLQPFIDNTWGYIQDAAKDTNHI